MKLYRAKVYIVNPQVPYFKLYKVVKSPLEKILKISFSDGIVLEDKKNDFLIEKKEIYVRKKFFFKAEDVQTGLIFHRVNIFCTPCTHEKTHYFARPNERVYVDLEEELLPLKVREIYEATTKEDLLQKKEELLKIIDEQKQYCTSTSKKNRQYVKMLEQKRNS